MVVDHVEDALIAVPGTDVFDLVGRVLGAAERAFEP
jgi:hypothetical protein